MVHNELAGRLVEALSRLDEVARALTPDAAVAEIHEATLEVFWWDWPDISAWAAGPWRRLDEDLAQPARPRILTSTRLAAAV